MQYPWLPPLARYCIYDLESSRKFRLPSAILDARKAPPRCSTRVRKMDRKSAGKTRKRWSGRVTRESHALQLEEGVFTWKDPARIARSLRDSAESSTQRKATPFRSAMSMLVFYINRAGKDLDEDQRIILEQAKTELR